jgi:hypothetical protein
MAFSVADGGGVYFGTPGTSDQINVDHAQVRANDDASKPAGLAFIELRNNNGVLVNEVGVPATALVASGRFYGEMGSNVDTGVAVANPDMAQSATITFKFTDSEGNDFGEGLLRLQPGGQLTAFLDQAPFFGPASFKGSVSFDSSIPVSVIALRGLTNERSEFLTTTLPVLSLGSSSAAPVVVPQTAVGGGWSTAIILLNPTDDSISGTVRFLSPEGTDQSLSVEGINASSVVYSIPPRTSRELQATGGDSTLVGSFVVQPDQNQVTPSVSTVYAYVADGVTVSTAGSPAIPTSTEFDVYTHVEGQLGTIGSVQTGIAIANPGDDTSEVEYELVRFDGSPAGISGKMTIAPHGQRVSFIREFPGASDLPLPFKGVLRLTSMKPIAALAIRGRYNEHGEFLLSTTPPADPAQNLGDETFIPQIVDGAGYSTDIVIYDLLGGSPLSGNIYFFDQNGQPIDPGLRQAAVLPSP